MKLGYEEYRSSYSVVVRHTEKAHAQTAHLVFAFTKANTKKPKKLFFCQRSTETEILKN